MFRNVANLYEDKRISINTIKPGVNKKQKNRKPIPAITKLRLMVAEVQKKFGNIRQKYDVTNKQTNTQKQKMATLCFALSLAKFVFIL